MRRGALLKDAQLSGMSPTSVAGGEHAAGNLSRMAGFCGPGSLTLLGYLELIGALRRIVRIAEGDITLTGATSGVAFAVVIVAAVTTPPAAVAASMPRLENIVRQSCCKRAL
jgi:hypothetical protein